MKYDIYCSGMWTLLKRSFKREIRKHLGNNETRNSLKKAKNEYFNIIERTEGIGKVKHNPLIINLINCVMLISIYQSLSDKFTVNKIGDIYIEAMRNCFVVKMAYKKNIFTEKWQTKRKKVSLQAKINDYKNDWIGEFVKGDTINEFGINYTECGICKLCAQEGCAELAKQMCRFDYISVEIMGAELRRTKTIANGDGVCDFWFINKNSS